MLKKISFIIAILFTTSLLAQKLEITPQYGYQLGAKYNYYRGYVKLDDSDQYGVTVGVNAGDDITLEFMWAQQNSKVSVKDYIGYPIETELSDIKVDHYQIGAIYMFDDDQLRPFVGLSGGWSTWNPEDVRMYTNTTFTFGITGGMKYFFTDHIGIRLQSQLLLPAAWGGVYVGGGGSGVYASGTIAQLNFSAGLIIGLGN